MLVGCYGWDRSLILLTSLLVAPPWKQRSFMMDDFERAKKLSRSRQQYGHSRVTLLQCNKQDDK